MNKSLTRRTPWFQRWLRQQFLEKKLNSVLGVIIMTLFGIGVTYSVSIDLKFAFALPFLFAGILMVITCIRYPYFSFYFTIAFAAVLYVIERIINLQIKFPWGVLIELFTYLTVLGIFLKPELRNQVTRKFWSNPISLGLYILLAFYLIEFFNPEMLSKEGYFNYMRKQIIYVFLFYASYCLLNTKKRIIFFSYFLVILAGILALYTCKQQWFGYFDFESAAIMSTPKAYELFFQGGFLRKFSTLADPATASIFFSSSCIHAIILAVGAQNKKMRRLLIVIAVLDVMANSFTGTRTGTLMLVSAIVFYGLATINEKRTFIFLGIALSLVAMLMVVPSQNVIIIRMKSTFNGTSDASAALRDINRHAVQPYLWQHPLGGGIFTCGEEGAKYNQGHFLSTFQPDGGYMKTLAEQGPVGLGFLLIFYLLFMKQGIRTFYRARDPEIQTHSMALLAMMFALLVGQYAQMAIIQFPITLYFFCTLAVFLRFPEFDSPETTATPNLQT